MLRSWSRSDRRVATKILFLSAAPHVKMSFEGYQLNQPAIGQTVASVDQTQRFRTRGLSICVESSELAFSGVRLGLLAMLTPFGILFATLKIKLIFTQALAPSNALKVKINWLSTWD